MDSLNTRTDLEVDIEFEQSRAEQLDLPLGEYPHDTPPPRLIGLSGRAGSGKSLAAQTLINHGYVRVKFADPLKNALRAILSTSGMEADEIERRIEGDLKEEMCGVLMCTPRHAMQTLGQEWGRDHIDPKLWLSLWRRRVYLSMEKGHNVVVDDVRYENEWRLIKELGGDVYFVDRMQATEVTHLSEVLGFPTDGTLFNLGTKADLIQQVKDRFL